MTIICAIIEEGVGTWIGSDTLVTSNSNEVLGTTNKWGIGDEVAIGVCGNLVALNLLHENINEVKQEWSGTKIFKWASNHLKEFGFKPESKDDGNPAWYNFSMIVATKKHIMLINGSGATVQTSKHNVFVSSGSGTDHADGAAYVLDRLDRPHGEIIRESILAAIAYNTTCGGDVLVDCLKL